MSSKIDLHKIGQEKSRLEAVRVFQLSAKTSQGLPELLAALEEEVVGRLGGVEGMPLTRLRHRRALEETVKSLERSLRTDHCDPALTAEDIRMAARALGRITGRIDVEDVLDVVFADFCIGK